MANRLSAIATRTGDDGTTGLGDGSRTPKDAIRVQSMGDVDELNSMIGLLLTEKLPDAVRDDLTAIQHDLFDLGGELCIPGFENISEPQLARLDENIARYNADLPRLAEFILPGGSKSAAIAHLCRTICRRAERSVVTLSKDGAARALCQQYLNRLSDLMFVLSRVLNRADGGTDVLWQQGKNKPSAE
ncbi:MAG: cob(I)yrinic acid a,c-diamide adenosyltransferase [Burkholderiaceae bacterium]